MYNVLDDQPVPLYEHTKNLSSQAFGFNLRTNMVECFRTPFRMEGSIQYVWKPGNPVIALKRTEFSVQGECYITYVRNILQGE